MQPNHKLTAFLYLLIRDHLPSGKVAKLIMDVHKITENIEYTNEHLEALAKDYATRITED